jgi:hypothetical protein
MLKLHFIVVNILLFAVQSYSQTQYLQLKVDGTINVPKVDILLNTGNYEIKAGNPGIGFGLGYTYLSKQNIGFSIGVNYLRKQYAIYKDVNGLPNAVYKLITTPHYYSVSIPSSFIFRHYTGPKNVEISKSKNFITVSSGISLNFTKEYAIRSKVRASGNYFGINAAHKDNFSFSSAIGYEIFVSSAYNLKLKNANYIGIGVGYTISPANYASLAIMENVNGVVYEGMFKPKMLNYFSTFITYPLTKL